MHEEKQKTYRGAMGSLEGKSKLGIPGLRWEDAVKGKVKFNLEQATKAQRGSRGVALLFP
jgi:hypothetical protein